MIGGAAAYLAFGALFMKISRHALSTRCQYFAPNNAFHASSSNLEFVSAGAWHACRGATGVDMLPHKQAWFELWGLVQDGVQFVTGRRDKRGYASVSRRSHKATKRTHSVRQLSNPGTVVDGIPNRGGNWLR